MSNCSDGTKASRSAPNRGSKRSRLRNRLAHEWKAVIDGIAWLGGQLSASAITQQSDQELLSLLQLFDTLHQQIRALSDVTVELADESPRGNEIPSQCLTSIEAIPFADMRKRLIGSLTGNEEPRAEPGGAQGAIDWL